MKIQILTSSCKNHNKNGDERYADALIKYIKLEVKGNIQIEFVQPNSKLNFVQKVLFDLFVLPIKVISSNADIIHALSPGEAVAPILLNRKTIVTLHDVIYITHPNGTSIVSRLYFAFCSIFIRKAELIITSSNFSKQEINETLKIPLSKIKKIYLGIDKKFKYSGSKNNKKDIGYLGGMNGRKNVDNLIIGFKLFQEMVKDQSYRLVISFKPNSRITNLIKKLNIKNVKFLGGVPESKIVRFYNSLSVFVYPSQYEGFGFPPLEAMACKCPVICNSGTSISEIVKDTALKIDTGNPYIIAKAIRKLFLDKKITAKFINNGFKNSRNYTWSKTAKKTMQTYKEFKIIDNNLCQ